MANNIGDRFQQGGETYEIVGHYSMSCQTQKVDPKTDKPAGMLYSMIPPDEPKPAQPDEQLNNILQTLESQAFYDWYRRDFADYIQCDDDCKTKDEILADLRLLFGEK